MFSQPGASFSGTPRSSVLVAFATISSPAISREPVVAVVWTSCRIGAEAPTITILPENRPGGNSPLSTFE